MTQSLIRGMKWLGGVAAIKFGYNEVNEYKRNQKIENAKRNCEKLAIELLQNMKRDKEDEQLKWHVDICERIGYLPPDWESRIRKMFD